MESSLSTERLATNTATLCVPSKMTCCLLSKRFAHRLDVAHAVSSQTLTTNCVVLKLSTISLIPIPPSIASSNLPCRFTKIVMDCQNVTGVPYSACCEPGWQPPFYQLSSGGSLLKEQPKSLTIFRSNSIMSTSLLLNLSITSNLT